MKTKPKKTTVTIRLPKGLKEQIRAAAKGEGRTVTGYVRAALKTAMKRDDVEEWSKDHEDIT